MFKRSKMGGVENFEDFPTRKKSAISSTFKFSTMFSTHCGKPNSRKSKNFPALPFLLVYGKGN